MQGNEHSSVQLAAETPAQPLPAGISTTFDLIDTSDGYRICGSECLQCGCKFYPRRTICAGCASQEVREFLFGPYGTLYSFTTVHVSSSRPTPYTVGYVDLDEGVRIFATIAGNSEMLSPDTKVRLSGGTDLLTFEPVANPKAG